MQQDTKDTRMKRRPIGAIGTVQRWVRKYTRGAVLEHWGAVILVVLLALTGFLPFVNWFVAEVNIYEFGLPVLPDSRQIHLASGIMLLMVALGHVIGGALGDRSMITKQPTRDIKATFHSLIYLVGFARREETGGRERFGRTQKINYLMFAYTLSLTITLGVSLILREYLSGAATERSLRDWLWVAHTLAGTMVVIVLVYHVAIKVRALDGRAFAAVFCHGKVPLWHVKKNNKLWYRQIMEEQGAGVVQDTGPLAPYEGKDPVERAVSGLISGYGAVPREKQVQKLATQMRWMERNGIIANISEDLSTYGVTATD